MAKLMERIKEIDLYELLNISPDADEKAVKKAYRKKALYCHPDKNPNNPKAAEEFHTLSDAYEVLTDPSARKAYDNLLKARKAAELRTRQLDAKRRKLKEDLEAREKAAREENTSRYDEVADEEKLRQEIERLQRQGRSELEKEQERMRQEILEAAQNKTSASTSINSCTKLKLKWKDKSESVYDQTKLRRIFSKYGSVNEIVVMSGKKGKMSALVDMQSPNSALSACKYETGLPENPLVVKLVGEDGQEVDISELRGSSTASLGAPFSDSSNFSARNTAPGMSLDDLEAMVMKNIEEAASKKVLDS